MKKITLLFISLSIIISVTGFAQRSATNIRELLYPVPDDGIQAAFTVNARSGFAPFTVTFTDQSTGEIQSWNWQFGDGQTSNERHPVHTYTEVGNYTVSLTVSNTTHTYTLEKEDYIIVKSALGDCDTLDYPFSGTYTYYILNAPEKGYVSGTNSYNDLAKANLFETSSAAVVTGAFVDFAKAKHISGTNPNIKIVVWSGTGNQGRPGQKLAIKEVPLSDIVADVTNDVATWVVFNEPVNAGTRFFVGAELPSTNDTLAFWTNTHLESSANIGWEQWNNQTWYPYSSDQSWGLLIHNAIHPVVCQVSGSRSDFPEGSVAVYPVPARERIYVTNSMQNEPFEHISLYDLQGKLVAELGSQHQNTVSTLKIDHLPNGLYILRAVSQNHILNQKITISR